MESNSRLAQEKIRTCSRWSELEFVSYCQGELAPAHLAELESHLEKCGECRERFNLSCDIFMADSLPEDCQADSEFLSSPLWQQRKEEIARSHARTIRAIFTRIEPGSAKGITLSGVSPACAQDARAPRTNPRVPR